ncbi:MAG TPA: response regulator [Herpetosiphonaceae bacterium]|nr:response regulator [Herpetosiphonaceae bacterium]
MAKACVFVIDDDLVFLEMMGEILREEQYRPILHSTGHDAFDAVRAQQPDIVLLDVRLEGPETGWTILDLLRLDRATAQIPVILCTGDREFLRNAESQLREAGCCVLEKPFSIDDLSRLLERSLKAHAYGDPSLA